jgi:FkbM family methyltransferase
MVGHEERSTALDDQLEELLGESIDAARARERSTFDELIADSDKTFILFGAGNLGRKTLTGMRSLGMEPIGFADNNPHLWGTSLDGIPVMSPSEASRRYGGTACFLTCIWRAAGGDRQEDRQQQLVDLGCRTVVPFGYLYWKFPAVFLPHASMTTPHGILENADKFRAVWSLWADEDSRQEYLAQLRFRMWLDYSALRSLADHPQYFADDLVSLSSQEVFVDCGAFDGDTIRQFLQRRGSGFAAICAYEPDELNFSRLQECIAGLDATTGRKVTARQVAVGARYETVQFISEGTVASRVGLDGTVQVECVPLDGDLAGVKPTFIKMDVEGFEMDALTGASRSIQAGQPVLTICVYHKPDDLWRVPLFIDAMSDAYRFFLRAHDEEGWDLVCYAVPAGRLLRGR